jgi:hypothetical protein
MASQVSVLVYWAQPKLNDIAAKRGVTFAGEQATAGQGCMGVSDSKIEKDTNGKVNCGITAVWETGAAIPAGADDRLMVDAQGRIIPFSSTPATNQVVAKRLRGQTATAAGQEMEVFVIPSVG